MNTHPSYTLGARPETGRTLRAWAVLSHGTFSGLIFLTDVALIVAMSCFTGVAYHLAAYGEPGSIPSFVQVGVLAASLFAVSNAFRGEYRLANFFAFRPHGRRTVRLWNVTFVCLLVLGFLAQISVGYSRGWIVLFYIATFAGLIVLRFAIVRLTALARSAGLVSAQRIFLIGTGAHVGAFVHRYEPWTLGASVIGCRFLTPIAATASAQERRATLERDLAEAVAGVRSLEPDAIFLLMPWSATEIIERCAETFLALPVEIHLGPEPQSGTRRCLVLGWTAQGVAMAGRKPARSGPPAAKEKILPDQRGDGGDGAERDHRRRKPQDYDQQPHGTGLGVGVRRRVRPGLECRLGPAQRRRGAFDVGDVARELIGFGARGWSGAVRFPRRAAALRRRKAAKIVQRGIAVRARQGKQARLMPRHGAHLSVAPLNP